MSKNKILYEYLDNTNNIEKEKNYASIFNKIESKEKIKKTIFSWAMMLFAIIIMTATSTSLYAKKSWDEEYEKYKNRPINYVKSIVDTKSGEYNVNTLDTDYTYNDGIGIKIDRISISDSLCQIDIKFKIDEEGREENIFEFGYAIYDENNIYILKERIRHGFENKVNYEKKILQELGVKYKKNKKEYLLEEESITKGLDEKNDRIVRINLISAKEFPKGDKIYIRIFDIGYVLSDDFIANSELIINDSENFEVSNIEWQFEIEIPEDYYQNNN